MCIFGVTENVGIAFRVGSSYKKLKPHMRTFEMAQNAFIAFRVGLFQSDFVSTYCV